MKIQWGKQGKDRSLSLLHAEAASSSAESAGGAFQSTSLVAVGGNAASVSLLSCLLNLVLAVMLLKVPSLLEGKQNALKRTTVMIALVSAFAWLPLIFVMLLGKNVSPFLVITLWVVNMVPSVLVYPLRDHWLAGMVPMDRMGRYLSVRSIFAGIFYLTTFVLMGWMVNVSGQQAKSYAIVLALAFLASAITVLLYFQIRAPAPVPQSAKKNDFTFFAFLKDTRKSHLGTFIVFVSMYTFAVNLASPLYASYMLDDLKFTMGTFTAMIACEYLARAVSLSFWGKMVDQSGALRLMSIVAYFIPLFPIMWIFSTNIVYLLSVQLLSGTLWAAFDLSVQTFLYKAIQPEQRLRYIVYYRSLTSFSVAFGALAGMFMLGHMFTINGSHILGIFVISGVLRLVIARAILPRLTPQGIPDAVVHPELATELAYTQMQPRLGLYYHPEAWRQVSRKAARFGSNIIGKTVGALSVSRNGLFYKPAKWADYLTGKTAQPAMATIDIEPSREGLYHNPEQWREYKEKHGMIEKTEQAPVKREGLFHNPELWADLQKQLGIAPKVKSQTPQREGLFLNPERWTDYLEHSLVLNAMTVRNNGETIVTRQPVYSHPELWERYQKDTAKESKAKVFKPAIKKGLLYNPEEWQKYKERTAVNKQSRKVPAIGTTISVSTKPLTIVRPQQQVRVSLQHQNTPRLTTTPTIRRIKPIAIPA